MCTEFKQLRIYWLHCISFVTIFSRVNKPDVIITIFFPASSLLEPSFLLLPSGPGRLRSSCCLPPLDPNYLVACSPSLLVTHFAEVIPLRVSCIRNTLKAVISSICVFLLESSRPSLQADENGPSFSDMMGYNRSTSMQALCHEHPD